MPRSSAQRLRERVFGWVAVPVLTLAAAGLLLEGVLRLLPVNEGCRTPPVNDAWPMMTCTPDRDFTWSRFPDFSMRNQVRANNLGFINDQDYVAASSVPLVAVVGDSLVEALMIPYGETLHGRLASALDGRARVYSFAASGAQLAQYLAYAAYARDRFHPSELVVVVAPNDFAASFRRYVAAPGFHYLVEQDDGEYDLERFDFNPGFARSLVGRSRLLLYLAINVEIGAEFARLRARLAGAPAPVDPDAARREVEARLVDARLAADLFLDRVPGASGLEPDRILLVMDAARPIPLTGAQASTPRPANAFDDSIRRYFLARADALGFGVVDAEAIFLAGAGEPPAPLEFPHDTHWNPRAHGLIAEAVLATPLLRAIAVH